MLRRFVVVAVAVLVACGPDLGTARVRPLPAPDKLPALRGGGPARSPRIASYKIDARLDVVRHQIASTQTLTWKNTGTTAVDRLPFHMYLNAFKNEDSRFMSRARGEMRGAEASADSWGWIDVESVHVAGVDLTASYKPRADALPDETVFELALAAPVAPGASIDVTMKVTAQLPEVWARTGYHGEFHLVGQWFPKIGVRGIDPASGQDVWHCEPFHAYAEFFADFGTYDVALTVPSTYVVAATGVLTAAVESPGGTRTLTYRAEDVHDFAWMADPYMEVISDSVMVAGGGAVDVRVYYRPGHEEFAARHLDAAGGAMRKFSEWFVPYPWPIMTVIDPPMGAVQGAGGMEYPTFVTTAGDSVFARDGLRLPEYTTVHEVGHNWFQGILASNEPAEPWLDEGVNSWADANVMNAHYGPRASAVDWMGWQTDLVALQNALTDDSAAMPVPIATAAAAFVDFDALGQVSYGAAARALHTLEQYVGPQKFAAAMKTYAETWAFRHPTGKDLFDVLTAELDQDLTWFFGPVFQQVGGVRLAVRSAECRRAHPPRGVFGDRAQRKTVGVAEARETGTYECEVVVTSTGPVHVPVDIELRFADGTTQRERWDSKPLNGKPAETWKRWTIPRSSPLVEVWLDPDAELSLATPTTLRYRLDGDGAASLRAAAWTSSIVQTLLQVVGP